ncbi:hypothetical protein F2P79_003474 [Pimephales promelas]|nr:hypothetical protein F2P79_003474 [Pimephales promelas]
MKHEVQLRKAVKAQICCVVCGFSLWRCLARSVPDWSLFEFPHSSETPTDDAPCVHVLLGNQRTGTV